jgi:hypothetical protein
MGTSTVIRKFSWLLRFFSNYIRILNPKRWRGFILAAEASKGFNSPFAISYSQAGEDLSLLATLFTGQRGSYIDIGCYHPSRFSVTRLLYDAGWRGVNVDANRDLVKEFIVHRPEDKNLVCAVGMSSHYEINILSKRAMSSVDDSFVSRANELGIQTIRIDTVEGRTLRSILDEHFNTSNCTLLNLDIEGLEEDALFSIDFETLSKDRYPEWILIETSPPIAKALSLKAVQLAIHRGYTPYLVLPMATLLKRPEDERNRMTKVTK